MGHSMRYILILLNLILIPTMMIPCGIGFLYRLTAYAFIKGIEIADKFMSDDVPNV